jgi:hypothetical protein
MTVTVDETILPGG